MTRPALAVAAFVAFTILATANAGGYRYGVSDQAFYVPAISLRADPSLFPRDRAVFEPQMALWLGDELLGAVVRTTGVALPALFGALYLVTMALLVAGSVALARAFGCRWPTIVLTLVVMTLRHRIAKTGANSLEGYMHPRMLAFALGLLALAAVLRLRWTPAVLWTIAAAVVHPSTAMWFGGVVLIAAIWQRPPHVALLAAGGAAVVLFPALAPALLPNAFPLMDAEWLGVLADRDYLFSLDWPAYAWILNLGSVALVVAVFRRRSARGVSAAGEGALLAGLLALVIVFLATLPATESRVAFFVALQANRVFWILDVTLAVVGAWWLMEDLPRLTHRRVGVAIALAVAAFSVARGVYVLRIETNRPLVEAALPRTTWTDIMTWLATQPPHWNVLADPEHAWKFGTSVRVAALRDTPLELGKDPAMAMYDRALAARVADRRRALQSFDALGPGDIRRLAAAYDLDVFVDRTTRHFDLPELYRNEDFVTYDLR